MPRTPWGYRFRLHRRDLPGTPDLVFPRLGKVIQVHGCFWHQHEGCRLARPPKSRLGYWQPKLARNRERDAESQARLEVEGWAVLVAWECETRAAEALSERLRTFLEARPREHPRGAWDGQHTKDRKTTST